MIGIEQAVLPFDESEPALQSVLTLDDDAILENSLAVAGFSWDGRVGLTGEVFKDGCVAFHDRTEYMIPSSELPRGELNFVGDEAILRIIRVAYDIKTGRRSAEC